MNGSEYQKLAMKTLNPKIPKDEVLINGVMGLCGESGEVIDLVKKHLYQGHELDKEKISKELGDVMWYIAEICEALNISLDEVMQGNIDKLQKRFKDGFTVSKSINREE